MRLCARATIAWPLTSSFGEDSPEKERSRSHLGSLAVQRYSEVLMTIRTRAIGAR